MRRSWSKKIEGDVKMAITIREIKQHIKGYEKQIKKFENEIKLRKIRINELEQMQGALEAGYDIFPKDANITDYQKPLAAFASSEVLKGNGEAK